MSQFRNCLLVLCHVNLILYSPSRRETGMVDAGEVHDNYDNGDLGRKGELEEWRPHTRVRAPDVSLP